MQRQLYHVNFHRGSFDSEDIPLEGIPVDDRHPVSTFDPTANAVSSFVDGCVGSDCHLPVVDFDHELTDYNKGRILWAFPDARFVPSTHYYHVYSDTPISWAEYKDKLEWLHQNNLIQSGFLNLTITRGAGFLRLPGITKTMDAGQEVQAARYLAIVRRYDSTQKVTDSDLRWVLGLAHAQILSQIYPF